MAKVFYEIGLMVQATVAEDDFETVEWEDDFSRVSDARKRARELSRKCPIKTRGKDIIAISITAHSDEEDISSYYLHWTEIYKNGELYDRIDY